MTLLKGRYKIIRKFSSGGFGETYLAEDRDRPGNPVCVVKQLRPDDPACFAIAKRLFETEAAVLETLGHHSQIPQLLAHIEENQQFYLVQEYIKGHTLSQELQPQPRWREDRVVDLLQDVLATLEFVHQNNAIHRDLKPDNLIRRDSDRRLVLIDFGAVKQIKTSIAATGQTIKTVTIGTPGYMPSEQSQGKPRFNSDIYALGVIAIQALTGIEPQYFQDDPDTGEIVWQKQTQVSQSLANILDKMVKPYFRDRYQSVAQVLIDLQNLQGSINQTFSLSFPTQQPSISVSKPIRRKNSTSTPKNSVASTPVSSTPVQLSSTIVSKPLRRKPSSRMLLLFVIVSPIFVFLVGVFGLARMFLPTQTLPVGSLGNKSSTSNANVNPAPKTLDSQTIELLNHGQQFRDISQYEKALAAYNQAIANNPNYAEAYWGKCEILIFLYRSKAAVVACDKALELKPNYAEAWASRGLALAQLGQETEALRNSNKAIQLNPNSEVVWTHQGYALEHLKRYNEALAACDKAIQLAPNHSYAWSGRGNMLWELKRYDAALIAYSKSIQLTPNYTYAWSGRGNVLWGLKRYDEALEAYDKAIQLKSDYSYSWHGRGNVLWELKRYGEALESYDKAIKLKSDYSYSWYGRGTVLWELKRYDEALETYDEAIKIEPDYAYSWNGRGNALWELRRYDEALEAYDKAIKLDPTLQVAIDSRNRLREMMK